MSFSFGFFLNSILLGVGLAMDAFSVSLANGLTDPGMKRSRMAGISGTYAFFQWFMPMTGWILVHTVAQFFTFFEKMIPWIAFLLLAYIGGKMLIEGIQDMKKEKTGETEDEGNSAKTLTFGMLVMQGVATSIDALSVGFTIADYGWFMAFISSVVIGLVTWVITISGLAIGKKFGTHLAGKATILGGVILIGIGVNILLKSLLGY